MSHEILRTHPNIVRLHGITWAQIEDTVRREHVTTPVLVVELASLFQGKPLTLELFILNRATGGVSLRTKKKLLADIASGLVALHALDVIHGDVKPDNVLMFGSGSSWTTKLSDFGFCITRDSDTIAAPGGTPFWSPPECLSLDLSTDPVSAATPSRDYFSFGLVIW